MTATILANIVLASIFLLVNEMMAAGRGRTLALINAIGGGSPHRGCALGGADRSVCPPCCGSVRRGRRQRSGSFGAVAESMEAAAKGDPDA